jgi:hypothetical protein
MGALREQFSRCSERIAIALPNDGIGPDELTVRAEIIAAILHLLLPPATNRHLVSKEEIKSALWRNYDRAIWCDIT